MSDKIADKDKGNIIPFAKLDIHPFSSKKLNNERLGNNTILYMVIGSNNDDAKKAFENAVHDKLSVNYRGLLIKGNTAILTGNDILSQEFDYNFNHRLESINKDAVFWIPSGFDHEANCVYTSEKFARYYETYAIKFLKYAVARIGNPKYYLLFQISKADYKASDFYQNIIKPKFR